MAPRNHRHVDWGKPGTWMFLIRSLEDMKKRTKWPAKGKVVLYISEKNKKCLRRFFLFMQILIM